MTLQCHDTVPLRYPAEFFTLKDEVPKQGDATPTLEKNTPTVEREVPKTEQPTGESKIPVSVHVRDDLYTCVDVRGDVYLCVGGFKCKIKYRAGPGY